MLQWWQTGRGKSFVDGHWWHQILWLSLQPRHQHVRGWTHRRRLIEGSVPVVEECGVQVREQAQARVQVQIRLRVHVRVQAHVQLQVQVQVRLQALVLGEGGEGERNGGNVDCEKAVP